MKLYTKILLGMLAGIMVGFAYNLMPNKERFDRIDTNSDRYISWEENAAASDEDRLRTSFTNTDSVWVDKVYVDSSLVDGVWYHNVIKEEKSKRVQQAVLKHDKNKDQQLSFAEYKEEYGWQRFTRFTDWIGTIFIALVKMVVVPLVVVSLVLGSATLGDIRKVGKMGAKAFGFFMFTTAVAVTIGLGVGNIFQPGNGLDPTQKETLMAEYQDDAATKTGSADAEKFKEDYAEKSIAEKLFDLLVSFVPENPLDAMVSNKMLGVIFFSLFLGICITLIDPDKAGPLIQFFDALNDAIIKMITLAMETAPYGVFALMLGVVAKLGLDILAPLLWYALAVVIGLILHIAITHASFIFFYVRTNPIQFILAIKEAIVMGFSTSSSSATLPISMNLAENNLGVSRQISSFVLPLGATINMDGTALYQAVAALFIAQVFGFELGITEQLTIILTATLASVGAAGVPGAGMITLALVLSTLGIPEAGIALIFGLDRLLDMCRTTVNIVGDLTLTAVMAKSEGETVQISHDKDVVPG